MDRLFDFIPCDSPVLVSVPHAGTHIPAAIAAAMTPAALRVEDTDWFVDELYRFAPSLGIGLISATHSRYVVDLNRDPNGAALYPGSNGTELVPSSTFACEAIYARGREPDEAEKGERVERYWRPYHARLEQELARIRDRFGVAVLWDGHSIRSRVPRLFDGALPDMNFGTAQGRSAATDLVAAVGRAADACNRYSTVWDGRFIGGHITRSYGRPEAGIHAIQLEMTWATYMNEHRPYALDARRAADNREFLKACLGAALAWARRQAQA